MIGYSENFAPLAFLVISLPWFVNLMLLSIVTPKYLVVLDQYIEVSPNLISGLSRGFLLVIKIVFVLFVLILIFVFEWISLFVLKASWLSRYYLCLMR